ncbi:MAG: 4Fe-4S binding protein [Campylobacterota bacterium]|nr:4Fe-4S binding protein [Campylobacterota bacterium]
MIELNSSACVRGLTKFSTCSACELSCPTDAIKIDGALPLINFSQCVGCGGCVGVCPSQALSLENFSLTNTIFSLIDTKQKLLTCKADVPCLSVFDVQSLSSLVIFKNSDIEFDMAYCDECEIASTCKALIENCVEESNYLLSAIDVENCVKLVKVGAVQDVQKEPTRRDFLSSINIQNTIGAKVEFDKKVKNSIDEFMTQTLQSEDIAKIREQKLITDSKKLFAMALKRLEKPKTYHVIDATDITFSSQKLINEATCSACQMCYRLCPTSALTSDNKNSKIDFDPFLCIACGTCHDVCESNALTKSPSFNIKELFEPKIQRLINFSVKRCNECNNFFISLNGEKLCHVCKIEEEDAMSLWGIES